MNKKKITDKHPPNPFLSKIILRRLELRLNQKEVSQALGIQQPTYSAKERGTIKFSIEDRSKLAKILDFPELDVENRGASRHVEPTVMQYKITEPPGLRESVTSSYQSSLSEKVSSDIHLTQLLDCWDELSGKQKEMLIDLARNFTGKPDYSSFRPEK